MVRVEQQHGEYRPLLAGTEIECLLTPFPPVRPGLKAMAKLPRVGGLAFVRTLLSPASTQFDQAFGGDGADGEDEGHPEPVAVR